MPASSDSNTGREAEAIAAAAHVLADGGIVVYPTETLYALGADAYNLAALQRLNDLKVRAEGKPISVLIGDLHMLRDLAADIPPEAEALMRRFWPGALTLALRAQPSVSPLLTGGGSSIGVRLSSHRTATALVRALGHPVTAPSANPAGMPPPVRIDDARAYFGAAVDCYVDGGQLRGEPASTVVDVRAGRIKVIRAGTVPEADIQAVLRMNGFACRGTFPPHNSSHH